MNNSFIYKLFVFCIILIMLDSIHAWFLWAIPVLVLDFFTACVAILYLGTTRKFRRVKQADISIFLLYCLATFWQQWGGLEVLASFHPSFFFLLYLTNDKYKDIVKTWTTTYACILSVSLVAWFIIAANPAMSVLPNLGIITYDNVDDYTFFNYGLCLWRVLPSLRFNSIFLEPGHVAMYAVFTIVANRFNFKKWQIIVLFVSLVFTFSLAGYLLIILGAILYYFLNSKSFKWLILSFILLGVTVLLGYHIAVNYESGDNLVNLLIVERLEYDEETGIAGNNRTSMGTDQKFDKLLESSDLWTGLPENKYKRYILNRTIKGAGYKMFLLQKGIVGIVLFLLVYYFLFKKYRDKKFGMTMLFLYLVAFVQRATPFTETWIYLFLFASAITFDKAKEVVAPQIRKV